MENKETLTKSIYGSLFMLMLLTFESKAQDSLKLKNGPTYKKIDSILLIDKAKLLCLSKTGVNDIDTIYHNLLAQRSEMFHTSDKFFDVITVKSDQFSSTQVKTKTGMSNRYCGENFEKNLNCFYTLVFSYHTYRFYLLSGFKESEIKELDNEMTKYHVNIYDVFSDKLVKQLPIDFDCLAAKYLYKGNKYKDKECYKECGKCMELAEVN